MSWHVTLRNNIGQSSRSMWETQKEFQEFYSGMMQDGSGDTVAQAYPNILYQGEDEQASLRAWEKDFNDMKLSPERLEKHFKAEMPHLSDTDIKLVVDNFFKLRM